MEYENYEDPKEESDEVDLSTDLTIEDKDLDFEEGFNEASILEHLSKKGKNQGSRFSLKARRAIEDHLEQRRLQKEMDYLFDDDFAADSEAGSKEPNR